MSKPSARRLRSVSGWRKVTGTSVGLAAVGLRMEPGRDRPFARHEGVERRHLVGPDDHRPADTLGPAIVGVEPQLADEAAEARGGKVVERGDQCRPGAEIGIARVGAALERGADRRRPRVQLPARAAALATLDGEYAEDRDRRDQQEDRHRNRSWKADQPPFRPAARAGTLRQTRLPASRPEALGFHARKPYAHILMHPPTLRGIVAGNRNALFSFQPRTTLACVPMYACNRDRLVKASATGYVVHDNLGRV